MFSVRAWRAHPSVGCWVYGVRVCVYTQFGTVFDFSMANILKYSGHTCTHEMDEHKLRAENDVFILGLAVPVRLQPVLPV